MMKAHEFVLQVFTSQFRMLSAPSLGSTKDATTRARAWTTRTTRTTCTPPGRLEIRRKLESIFNI